MITINLYVKHEHNHGELLLVVSTGKVNMQAVAFCQNTIIEKLTHQQNVKTEEESTMR